MAESITCIIDKETKRQRGIDSVYVDETIKKRLSPNVESRVIYEGEVGEDLEAIRLKLKHGSDSNLQIRQNKIYEIRRRLTKKEIITKTIKHTIFILEDKHIIQYEKGKGIDDLTKLVYNLFLGGSETKRYTLKSDTI